MSAGLPRIVVIGAGFAGLAAALRLDERHRVSVIDRSRSFEFLPNIHELVSAVKTPRLLRLPRDRIVRRAGHRFIQGSVEAIDTAARRVHVSGRRPLGYDALLVCLGGENATHGVPGAARHALAFKSVEDCHRIGQRLASLAAEGGSHDVVIVGGGLEGVEALGEVLRRYRRQRCFRIHVVEARERLVAGAPLAIDREVRRLASEHGVRFRTGLGVAKVEPAAVELENGETIPSRATIWTGGPAAPGLLARSGLSPRPGAWAPASWQLCSSAAAEVFVAGDAAALERPVAKQAYHALDMGRLAADNARRLLSGRRLRRYRPSEKPMLISFGDLGGFLVAGPLVVRGPALGAAKEAVFELVMAQLDQRSPVEAARSAWSRTLRAGRALAWPALSTPGQWPRMMRLSLDVGALRWGEHEHAAG